MITFEFDDDALAGTPSDGVGNGVATGNTAIVFSHFRTYEEIAVKIAQVIASVNPSVRNGAGP